MTGCPAGCECGGRTLGAVDASELYERQQLKEWFLRLVRDLPTVDVIELNRVTISSELAVQLRHDARQVLALARYELQADLALSAKVRRLQWLLTAEGPARQHERAQRDLAALGEDAVDRADRCDALIHALAGAVFLAGAHRAAELDRLTLVALTAPAGPAHIPYRAKAPTLADGVRDRIRLAGDAHDRRTLGHQRDRLRLAGNPDIRAKAGYGGRPWRGQSQGEPTEAELDALSGSPEGNDQGDRTGPAAAGSSPRRRSRGRRQGSG